MTALLVFTFLLLQIFCQVLITVGSERVLPTGYVKFSEDNAAYKIYETYVKWNEAQAQCIEDGANLAVGTSLAKIQHMNSTNPRFYRWVQGGIYRSATTGKWLRVDTDQRLPSESIRWRDGDPSGSGNCTVIIMGNGTIHNVDCTSSRSHFVCEIPLSEEISAVNNLAVTDLGSGFNVTWDPPNDVSHLNMYSVIATAKEGGNTYAGSTTNTYYTITDSAACTKYAVMVTPIDKDHGFGEATRASITTSDRILGRVIDLTAPSENITYSSVYLSWSKPTANPSCVLHYEVQRCHDSECTNDTTTDEFYNATGLDPCLTYDFTVVAIGNAGSSDAEGIAVTTSYIRPGIPRNISVTPGQSSLGISWAAPLVGGTCTKSYRVILWDGDRQTLSTSNTDITISRLVARGNYIAQITPISITNKDGDFLTVSGST